MQNRETVYQALVSGISDLLIRMNLDGTYLDFFPGSAVKLYAPNSSQVRANIYDVLPFERARERMFYIHKALDFAGITLQDVVNKPFWQAHWWQISPETQQQLQQAIANAAQGEFIRYEVDVQGVGGRVVTIDFSLRPIFDESGQVKLLIPEGRDISDRKQAEIQLQKQAQFLDSIYQGVEQAIFVVETSDNGEFHYVSFNPTYEQLTGLSHLKHKGKTPQEALSTAAANIITQCYLACLAAQKSISYEDRRRSQAESRTTQSSCYQHTRIYLHCYFPPR